MASNEWAHSYRTIANTLKQTAGASGAEAFNPYLKGGESGAKFNALAGTADYTGNILGTYANAMKGHQEEQARAGVAEQNRRNAMEKDIEMRKMQQKTDLIAQSDELKTRIFTPLYGEGFDQNGVQEAINYSIKIDNAIQQGIPIYDVQGIIKDTAGEKGLDPLVSEYLSKYAANAYSIYGKSYQETQLPTPQPSFWDKVKSDLGNTAASGWNKIKSTIGY